MLEDNFGSGNNVVLIEFSSSDEFSDAKTFFETAQDCDILWSPIGITSIGSKSRKRWVYNSMNKFFELNGFKETLAILQKKLPLDFTKIFNIFRAGVFFFFSKTEEKFFQKVLKLSQFLNRLMQREIIYKITIVHGCLQYVTNQKFVTRLVHDLEI